MKGDFFNSELRAVKVSEAGSAGRARWQLTAPLEFYSARLTKMLVVPTGFKTDFSSVPRLPLIFSVAGDTAHASATLHDYLYRHHSGDVERAMADRIFNDAMVAEKVPAWRRLLMFAGVRIGGGFKK